MLGRAVQRALEAHGVTVFATARRARPVDRVSALEVTDRAAVMHVVAQVDAIVHMASARALTSESEASAHETIVRGSEHIVHAAVARSRHVVLFGSAEEYGSRVSLPYREDAQCSPESAYGVAKSAATLQALRDGGSGVTVLRPSTVYGPGQPESMLVARCIAATREDGVVALQGGTQTRDHVHVADVARAVVLALQSGSAAAGSVVHVASGDSRRVCDVATLVTVLAGRGRVKLGPESTRKGDVREMRFCTERAQRLLGFRSEISLEEGLRRTLDG